MDKHGGRHGERKTSLINTRTGNRENGIRVYLYSRVTSVSLSRPVLLQTLFTVISSSQLKENERKRERGRVHESVRIIYNIRFLYANLGLNKIEILDKRWRFLLRAESIVTLCLLFVAELGARRLHRLWDRAVSGKISCLLIFFLILFCSFRVPPLNPVFSIAY